MRRVTLRQKQIGNGRIALYLDIYPPIENPKTGKLTRKHYLKMHIYSRPKTDIERQFNKYTLGLAETLKAKKQLEIYGLNL